MNNCVTLNNGLKMPIIGFGVYLVKGKECFESVKKLDIVILILHNIMEMKKK